MKCARRRCEGYCLLEECFQRVSTQRTQHEVPGLGYLFGQGQLGVFGNKEGMVSRTDVKIPQNVNSVGLSSWLRLLPAVSGEHLGSNCPPLKMTSLFGGGTEQHDGLGFRV